MHQNAQVSPSKADTSTVLKVVFTVGVLVACLSAYAWWQHRNAIPFEYASSHLMVVWKALVRAVVGISSFAVGVIRDLREPRIWEKYHSYILGVLAFVCLETALVFFLVVQIKRKNRAKQMLERRSAIERVTAKYSERLLNCPPAVVLEEMREALNAVLESESADRAIWFTVTEEGEVGEELIFATREETPQGPLKCECSCLPWVMNQVRHGNAVSMPKLETLPEEAAADRNYLEAASVQSMLVVPSSSDKGSKATLVLLSYTQRKEWPDALVSRLGMLASVFGNAASRKRAEDQLSDKKEWLKLALEASMTALWELDVATGRVRWSQTQNSLLGKEPIELEVSWEKFLELLPEADREDLYGRAVALLSRESEVSTIVTEWRFHEPGGGERWLLFRGQVYRDANGKPLRLRGVNVDITDLKRVKTELSQLTERLLKAQEEERQRLARELHDDIGQRLSLLIIGLDRLKHELPLELRLQREELTSTLEEANALATDIHGLSHQLHSTKLKHLGLKSALRELCSHVAKQHDVDVRLMTGGMRGKLSEERALCLYRVAQEGLTNAVKHSHSDRIDVELTANGVTLQLTVRDFGCGFDLSHYEAGLGLASMRERLRMVGGELQVQTAPGRGTVIQTEVRLDRVARHASVA